MAIDFFKKKEVMNDIEKNNNDIVEDYGNYINNNETTISSFDSNFNENIGYDNEPTQNMDQVNYSNAVINENNQIIESNDLYNNVPMEEENHFNDAVIQNDHSSFEDVQITQSSNNFGNAQNINNYDYNPIIDNMENAEHSIKNSEDINVAFSNMYKNKKDKEVILPEPEKYVEQKYDAFENNDSVMIDYDYNDVENHVLY